MNLEEVLALLYNNNIDKLEFRSNDLGSWQAKQIATALKKNQSLTVLDIRYNKIGDKGLFHISDALKNHQFLKELGLGKNYITSLGAKYLSEALENNHSLVKLDIRNNQKIGDEGIKYLANYIKTSLTLREIDLGGLEISDKGIIYLVDALLLNPQIEFLSLANNYIGFDGVQELCRVLVKKSTSLKELRLSYKNKNMGDSEISLLADALKLNNSLEILHLDKTKAITDLGAIAIAEALNVNKTLKKLFLGGQLITHNGAICITKALLDNPYSGLTHLILYQNNIGDLGAENLATLVKINSKLKEINLWKNNISDIGLSYFADALLSNSSLKILDVAGNNFTDEGIKKMQFALQNSSADKDIKILINEKITLEKTFYADDVKEYENDILGQHDISPIE
jgi:Ran GTPase-activating protein (RanGAP) involved in mRNA processing and transport